MYEKILVPLDGSDLAEVALPYAEELAGRLGSDITLLYVCESAECQYRRMHQSYLQKMAENVKQGAERYLGKLVAKEIKVGSEVLVGNPAEKIVDYADEENIGLTVMSTHGRTGVGRWALGSVAYKVIEAVTRPLALIRAKGGLPDMREKEILDKALVPLDGSKESETVIPYIEELASKLKIELTLLRVLAPDYDYVSGAVQAEELTSLKISAQAYIEKMAAQFKQKGIAAKAKYREVRLSTIGAAGEIMELADETQADVVAMSTRGRSGAEVRLGEFGWSLGNVAEKIVHAGNTPLLLVRPS